MKVAVITGASSGIGLECAKVFSSTYKVYTLSRRGTGYKDAINMSCDVTDEEAVKKALNEIYEKEKHIDVLINNAGFGISGAVEFTDVSQAKKQFDVNFFGTYICSKSVIPYMRNNKSGLIINISSMAAPLSIPYQVFYSASKAAVNSFTMGLANEVKNFGIRVIAIMPGDVKTGFTADREKEMSGSDVYGDIIEKSVKTMEHDEQNGMEPIEIAKAAYKLSSKKNPKIISSVGLQYKTFAVLAKALPNNLVNYIVGKLYA